MRVLYGSSEVCWSRLTPSRPREEVLVGGHICRVGAIPTPRSPDREIRVPDQADRPMSARTYPGKLDPCPATCSNTATSHGSAASSSPLSKGTRPHSATDQRSPRVARAGTRFGGRSKRKARRMRFGCSRTTSPRELLSRGSARSRSRDPALTSDPGEKRSGDLNTPELAARESDGLRVVAPAHPPRGRGDHLGRRGLRRGSLPAPPDGAPA